MAALATGLPAGAAAEQASQPTVTAAGQLDVSGSGDPSGHTCALLAEASVRCWGFGGAGRLGYASTSTIGDDEDPGSVGPVDLGVGRTAKAVSAGAFHTCALLGDDRVHCWGFGGEGRLGYASTGTIGDDEPPGSVGPVDLGAARTAKAISAGGGHSCALLDDNAVRCWGFGSDGRLGHPSRINIGDDETPGSVGPVNLGAGRSAKAISAGQSHTCALLDDDTVRCWGFGANGQLGYGNTNTVGDNETPGSVGPVDLGAGRSAKAISAGDGHTCALLDEGSVRCWGFAGNGRLGYANTADIGDNETPGSVPSVDFGPGRTAKAISAGGGHSCALLDDGSVRCWGFGANGRLGYANTNDVGDDEAPASVGPVNLGPGRTAVAISAGGRHTCARLDDSTVRCWGSGANGRLGYCNEADIGDDEAPGSVGAVNLATSACRPPPSYPAIPSDRGDQIDRALASEARRARRLRACLARVGRHARRERRRARRGSARRRARAKHHLRRHKRSRRRACLKRYGRTPGRVTRPAARAVSKTKVILTFNAPGSDGHRPPASRTYLVKQSRRPIRGSRAFRRARSLCRGRCRFSTVTRVGAQITLTVTGLRPRTTYYYAVAARDNVSGRLGPRSRTVRARTR